MKITPTTLTINQLFTTMNEQFFIPAYQRRYAWKWKQAKELYDDINNLKNGDSHLLGNIVCLTSDHTAGINQLEVVDGQQRITTLSLLLHTFHNIFKKNGNGGECNRIMGMLKSKGPDQIPENKVLLGELDNDDYQRVLLQRDLENINNENLVNCYENFKNWLSELEESEFNSLYYKLLQSVSVIRLDVYQAKDAYKLFETINNRGLSLNHTDIIKNFLLGHASSFDKDTLDQVKENWKGLIIALDKLSIDDFFRQYICSVLRRKVTFTFLIDEFKKLYINSVINVEDLAEYKIYKKIKLKKEEDVEEELEDEEYEEEENEVSKDDNDQNENEALLSVIEFSKMLKDQALTYSRIRNRSTHNTKLNDAIFDLQRIKTFPGYIFLLPLFHDDNISDAQRLKILKMVSVFMLRRHICEYRTGELDEIFSKLINKLEGDNIIEQVRLALIDDTPLDNEFKLKFEKATYKGNVNRAKYVLEQFEYDKMGSTGELKINSGSDVHLEHIIPQTITTKKSKREFGDWEEYLGSEAKLLHKEYVDTIGNYTLLGQKLNIVASNNPFSDKLKEYAKSSIKITQEIVENYNDFKFNDLKQRSKELADYAPKIWKL
nr:DUF262 domain-containing protein [Gaetbulibacter saemankumensis]